MNLPEGARLTYTISHEAWYSDVVERPQIWVNGGAWEFVVAEHDRGDQHPIRVGVFEDSFAAFAQIPEFFAALADTPPVTTLAGVRAILDEFGAADETERKSPLRDRPLSMRARIAASLAGLVVDEGVRVPERDLERIARIVATALADQADSDVITVAPEGGTDARTGPAVPDTRPYAGDRRCLFCPDAARWDVSGFLACYDRRHIARAAEALDDRRRQDESGEAGDQCGLCLSDLPHARVPGESCPEHGHDFVPVEHPAAAIAEWQDRLGCPEPGCDEGRWVS